MGGLSLGAAWRGPSAAVKHEGALLAPVPRRPALRTPSVLHSTAGTARNL